MGDPRVETIRCDGCGREWTRMALSNALGIPVREIPAVGAKLTNCLMCSMGYGRRESARPRQSPRSPAPPVALRKPVEDLGRAVQNLNQQSDRTAQAFEALGMGLARLMFSFESSRPPRIDDELVSPIVRVVRGILERIDGGGRTSGGATGGGATRKRIGTGRKRARKR